MRLKNPDLYRKKDGQKFWTLTNIFTPVQMTEDYGSGCDALYVWGNYFRTKAEAEHFARKFKNNLSDYQIRQNYILDYYKRHKPSK